MKLVDIGKEDYAKYPFLPETGDFVKKLNFTISDLLDSNYNILENAKNRIIYGFKHGISPTDISNVEIDIFSFPLALLLVKSTNNSYAFSKFALAESKRIENFLQNERQSVIPKLFEAMLKIQPIEINDDSIGKWDYKIPLNSYLPRSLHLRGANWRLVNRLVDQGFVYVKHKEIVELLRSEIYEMIITKLDETKIPPSLLENQSISKTVKEIQNSTPRPPLDNRNIVFKGEYPPCVSKAIEMIKNGDQVKHYGKFLMTTFLLRAGKNCDDIVKMYPTSLGFNQNITRYQVEHIAGLKGGGTKYSVPSCKTMKTNDFCFKTEACGNITNPLQFRNKTNTVKKNTRQNH